MAERIVSETVTRKQRIPPGQYRTEKFPVLDLGIQLPLDPKDFRLKVWGDVEKPLDLDWAAFQDLPHVELLADFHCVTRWSRLELDWAGVHVREILRLARPKPSCKAIMAHGRDGYTTNLLLSDFDDEDVLLADRLQGKPVPLEHGGPVRLVVPKLYGWKSAKFLSGLEFLPADEPGYWEQRGYHMRGEYLAEQRYW